MASELGSKIRAARTKKGMGLRELARAIKKSPAFLTRLECDDDFPATTAETLKAIAQQLDMDVDQLLLGARRTKEVEPKTGLELALYRRVQGLTKKDQERLLKTLDDAAKE